MIWNPSLAPLLSHRRVLITTRTFTQLSAFWNQRKTLSISYVFSVTLYGWTDTSPQSKTFRYLKVNQILCDYKRNRISYKKKSDNFNCCIYTRPVPIARIIILCWKNLAARSFTCCSHINPSSVIIKLNHITVGRYSTLL